MAGKKSERRRELERLRSGPGLTPARADTEELRQWLGDNPYQRILDAVNQLGDGLYARALRAAYGIGTKGQFLTDRLNSFAAQVYENKEVTGKMKSAEQVQYWTDKALDDLEVLLNAPPADVDDPSLYDVYVGAHVKNGSLRVVETHKIKADPMDAPNETPMRYLERLVWLNPKPAQPSFPFFVYELPRVWIPRVFAISLDFSEKLPEKVYGTSAPNLMDLTTFNAQAENCELKRTSEKVSVSLTAGLPAYRYIAFLWSFE